MFKINDDIINDFIAKGIVPEERIRQREYSKQNPENIKPGTGINIPKRKTAKAPPIARDKAKSAGVAYKSNEELTGLTGAKTFSHELVWQKKKLPKSDAQQVSGSTKITGVIRLAGANFKVGNKKIDRNTYFRNTIFSKLKWHFEDRKNNTPLEVTKSKFNISINGKNIGVHELKISHDPERISDQDNIPTTIHWGSTLINYLKAHDVTGAIFCLAFSKKVFSRCYAPTLFLFVLNQNVLLRLPD